MTSEVKTKGGDSSASVPLTLVNLSGLYVIFKAVLSEEKWAAKLKSFYECTVYPDLDALWADDSYYGNKAEIQRQVDQPDFRFFRCEIDSDDAYRLSASNFPILDVQGKIVGWADWDFVLIEREGSAYLRVYKGPKDDTPYEIRLSSEQIALKSEKHVGYLKELSKEIREEGSVELEKARLEGRLVEL